MRGPSAKFRSMAQSSANFSPNRRTRCVRRQPEEKGDSVGGRGGRRVRGTLGAFRRARNGKNISVLLFLHFYPFWVKGNHRDGSAAPSATGRKRHNHTRGSAVEFVVEGDGTVSVLTTAPVSPEDDASDFRASAGAVDRMKQGSNRGLGFLSAAHRQALQCCYCRSKTRRPDWRMFCPEVSCFSMC